MRPPVFIGLYSPLRRVWYLLRPNSQQITHRRGPQRAAEEERRGGDFDLIRFFLLDFFFLCVSPSAALRGPLR